MRWKIIKNYPNYSVSDTGLIKRNKTNKIIKNLLDDRYYKINLYNNGKLKHLRVHRLVAEAFIPNPNNYKEINHKDENMLNNNVENLEWCNRKYNVNYGTRNERVSKTLSKKVLFENIIFNSINDCAKYFNVSPQYIGRMIKGYKKNKFNLKLIEKEVKIC